MRSLATFDRAQREAIVAEANRAPSVHNVQPTRWRFEPGMIHLALDPRRGLPVGDREGHDAAFSLGCALEGTRIALARRGFGTTVEPADGVVLRVDEGNERERQRAEHDHGLMARRRTHRLGFERPTDADRTALRRWAGGRDDIVLVDGPDALRTLSDVNDAASLAVLRNHAYRAELLGWMRLGRDDAPDGLSVASLGMTRVEAVLAHVALGPHGFRWLDRLGLAGAVSSERQPTLAAAGIAALTMGAAIDRPGADVRAGAAFLRTTLELVALGFQTWPMGVLVDDPRARDETARLLGIPPDRSPRIVFRIGRPKGAVPPAKRLPAGTLIDG